MTGKICRINRCEAEAHWTVTMTGHPNGPKTAQVAHYCTKHAREKAGVLWEESPRTYRITVDGPW
jgi:hypothetical protein